MTLKPRLLNAFCVDVEEWFHICAAETPYSDPSSWDVAPQHVERDTEALLCLLSEVEVRATFLTLGWIAEKYPGLVRKISDSGHEIGCHGYYHRLVYEQSRDEFQREVSAARRRLQDVSGQEIACFRAPGFSIRADCLWAYEVLAAEGFLIDVSIVPCRRNHGGIRDFSRAPAHLVTPSGGIRIYPMSVMTIAGRQVQFSGGGYLRLFPA